MDIGTVAAMGWLLLAGAISTEVAGTLALRALADGFRWGPATVVGVGYSVSFVLLALALRSVDVGPAYAIWSGVGTAGVAVLGVVLFAERINAVGVVGLVLIVAGVAVLSLSGSAHA
jgi:small multidrug resistance pump